MQAQVGQFSESAGHARGVWTQVRHAWIMSSNIAVINECQKMFSFQLPSEHLGHRTSRFLSKVALVNNSFIKYATLV